MHRHFCLVWSSWFDLYLFFFCLFFTHFDFVRMYDFRGNRVTPYMPNLSRQLCIMILTISTRQPMLGNRPKTEANKQTNKQTWGQTQRWQLINASLQVKKKERKEKRIKKEISKISVTLNLPAIKIRMYITQGILHGISFYFSSHNISTWQICSISNGACQNKH